MERNHTKEKAKLAWTPPEIARLDPSKASLTEVRPKNKKDPLAGQKSHD